MNMMSDDYTVNAQDTAEKKILSRRKLIQFGAYGIAGLAVASTFQREQEAEAVSPALAYIFLMGMTAASILRPALSQYVVAGSVTAENRTRQPQYGNILVTIYDAGNRQFNASGYFAYRVLPGQRVSLPYEGLVPQGSGYKIAHARSYLSTTPDYRFNWPY